MKQLFSQYAGLKKEIYILFIGKLVTAMGSFVWPMLTFFLTTKLGLSDGTSTLLIATASVVSFPAALLGGKLADRFSATFSVRSSVNSEKQELLDQLKTLCEFHGGAYSERGDYPAWEYKKESQLRDTMVRVYTQLNGKEPKVLAIHAGLECGLLGEKLPGLDCVSMGPQMFDIHTSRERLDIASTERTWKFLLEVLKNL